MNEKNFIQMRNEVDATIASIVEEFNEAINMFKNDGRFMRMRLLIAFSFAEVICGVFERYFNLKLGNTDTMKKWFDEYCLTDANDVYKKHLYFNKIDVEYLYQLRCSVIHAFALPERKGNLAVMFINGTETAQNVKKIDGGFIQKGLIPVFISPDSLTHLFIKGFYLLHTKIFTSENNLTTENYAGIERVYNEMHRRGAKPIPLK